MEQKWEILTDWKINLETEEDRFEYFNKEAFIPGKIYRIHRFSGLPVIVEFQKFGYRYNHDMSETYPRILICNETSDVPIDEITAICVYNIINDDENQPSESTKTADVSGFKDFVVSNHSYHVNKILNDIKPAVLVSSLTSDKINISGELKITGIDITIHYSSFLHTQCVRIELPTGDEITIPASDHPWIESNGQNFPVFIEDESGLKWHKDLATGEFYIILTKSGEKRPILIRSIHNDEIEYVDCYSRYSRDNCVYFVESIAYEMTIEDAKDYKFIPVKDVQ
jgi:hypothetical protein